MRALEFGAMARWSRIAAAPKRQSNGLTGFAFRQPESEDWTVWRQCDRRSELGDARPSSDRSGSIRMYVIERCRSYLPNEEFISWGLGGSDHSRVEANVSRFAIEFRRE